jgi:GTP-binding protein YchF
VSSSISCGIVGLPNVGKSTLFNALTNNSVLAANYPFATIEPNTGIVPVPDTRLEDLASLYKCQKIIPATVTFVDIAGLVSGASKGEGLGNQFLGHIRGCNAVVEVIRSFADSNIVHVDNLIDPKKDIGVVNTELILADIESLQKKLPKLEKEAKANPLLSEQLNLTKKVQEILNSGKLITSDKSLDADKIDSLQLITSKPIIYLFNVDEESLTNQGSIKLLSDYVAPSPSVFVSAKLEDELKGIEAKEAKELLVSYGQSESGLVQLISKAYDILGLQSFLTAGVKEVRAWTIKKGSTAQEAAGVIHTDFQKGFIAAEIVKFQDLIEKGSLSAAKAAGLLRTEGKTYIMQPDDIVEFRFNV